MMIRSLFVALLLSVSAVCAQTNFFWTNTTTGVTNSWSVAGNWTNDAAVVTAPPSANYTILNFFTPAATYVTTNPTASFNLNQLNFSNAAVTILGQSLVFTNTGAALPQVNQFGASNVTIATALTLATNTTFAGTGTGTITVSGVISGAGQLAKSGAGFTLVLSGTNTYTGGTVVNSGTLQINTTATALQGATVVSNAATLFLNVAGATYANNISGGGTVVVTLGTGSSTTTLSGNLSGFTGTLNIGTGTGGKIAFSTTAGYLPAAVATVRVLTNATLYLNSGNQNLASALQLHGGTTGEAIGQLRLESNATVSGPITLYQNSSVGNNTAGNFGYITGNIGETGGARSLNKQAAGTIVLSGTNTYSGGTTISGGQLWFTSTNAVPATGAITVNANTIVAGGFADIQNILVSKITAGSSGMLALLGPAANENIDFNTGAKTNLILGATTNITYGGTFTPYQQGGTNFYRFGAFSGATFTYTNAITGTSALEINKGGYAGVVLLTASNTFTAGTTLNAGVLNINSDAALGSVPASPSTNLTVTASATLRLATNMTLDANRILLLSAGTTTIEPLGNTATIAGIITGNGALTKGGTAATTLYLTGANSFTGGVTISAGALWVNNSSAFGTGSKNVTATSNVNDTELHLDGSGGNIIVPATISFRFSNDTLGTGGDGTLFNEAGTNTILGPITLTSGGGGTRINVISGSLTLAGNITPDTTLRILYLRGEGNGEITGVVADGSGGNTLSGLIKDDGNGTWTLSATNTYTGYTTISNGTLRLSATGSISNSPTITVASGARFDVADKTGYTLFGNQTLTGGGLVTGSVTVAANGKLRPTGTLTITGDLTLNAASTNYFGVTLTGADLLAIGGTLTPNASIISVTILDSITNGSYRLINAGTNLTGFSSTVLGNTTRKTLTLTETATAVDLNVSGSYASLVWNPTANANWDVATSTNWLNGASPDLYYDFDTVNFTDAGAATNTVTLVGTLRPTAVIVNSTSNYTFTGAGAISGTATLTKDGAGILTISNANSYTGGTIINGGQLRIIADSGLGATPASYSPSNIVLNGGTLISGITNDWSLNANRGIAIGNNGGTINGGSAAWFRMQGTMIDLPGQTGAIWFAGNVVLQQNATNNTYSGGATILPGAYVVFYNGSTGPAGAPTAGPFGTGTLTLAGGQLRCSTGGSTVPVTIANPVRFDANTTIPSGGPLLTFTGPWTLTGDRVLTVSSPSNVVISGAISDGGNGYSFTKAGANALTLSGASTFTGSLILTGAATSTLILSNVSGYAVITTNVINQGGGDTRLRIAANEQMAPYTVLQLGGNNAKFELNGFTQTVAVVTNYGSGNSIIQNLESGGTGTGLLIVSNDTVDSYFNGYLRNQSGTLALTKAGAATMTLVGGNITYTGPTLVNGGLLVLSNTTGFASSLINVANNAGLYLYAGANNAPGIASFLTGAGSITVDGPGGGDQYQNRIILRGTGSDQTGDINIINGGKLWVDRNINSIGDTALVNVGPNAQFYLYGVSNVIETIGALAGSGTVFGSGGSGTAGLILGNGNLSAVFSGNIFQTNSTTFRLTKIGSGTQVLAGVNYAYTGPTRVEDGTLILSNGTALSSPLAITNGATVIVTGNATGLVGEYYTNYQAPRPITNLTDFAIQVAGANATMLFNGSRISTNFDFGTSGAGFAVSGNNFSIRWIGTFYAPTNGDYTFGIASDDSSAIWIDGVLAANKPSSGLTAVYSTITNLTAGPHEIVIGFENGTGSYYLTNSLSINGGPTNPIPMSYFTTLGTYIGALSGTADSTLVLSNTILTVSQTTNDTFAGTITGDGTLRKISAGTLTLTGTNNNYTGGTMIDGGRLAISERNNLPSSGLISFNGGLLQILGTAITNLDDIAFNSSYLVGGFDIATAGHTVALNTNLTGTGVFIKAGPGTLVLTADNTGFTGAMVVTNGILQIGNNTASGTPGTGNIVLYNTGTIALHRTDTYTFSNIATGAGYLAQIGSGTLVLTGNQLFTGGAFANNGTTILSNVVLNAPLALSNGAVVTAISAGTGIVGEYYSLAGSTANYGTRPYQLAYVLGSANAGQMYNGPLNSTNFDFSSAAAFPPAYQGDNYQVRWVGTFNAPTDGTYVFGLNSDDASVLWIDGLIVTNHLTASTTNYYNSVTLTAGTHQVVIAMNEATGAQYIQLSMALPDGSTNLLPLSTLTPLGPYIGSLSGTPDTTLQISNTILTVSQTTNTTFAGTITGNGSLRLISAGTLALTGTNTYTGGTLLDGGRLSIGDYTNLPATGPITFNGGLLQITGTTITNLDPYTINWTNVFNGGFDIADAGHTLVQTNNITGGAYFTKAGAGTLLWTNNSVQLDYGQFYIRGGTLLMAGNSVFTNTGNVEDYIGVAAGEIGTLTLSGNSRFVRSTSTASYLNIGQSGTGILNIQDNAAFGPMYRVRIANNAGSTGIVYHTNGSFTTVNDILLGDDGVGTYYHYNGGVTNSGGWFYVGYNAGSRGTMYQYGGSVSDAGSLTIGHWSTGVWYQVGGTVQVSGWLAIGNNTTGVGAFYHTGGSLFVNGEMDAGVSSNNTYGFYQMSGGTMTNNSWVQAGRAGLGLIYQNGGSIIVTNTSYGFVAANNIGGNTTGVFYFVSGYAQANRMGVGWNGSSRGEVTIAGDSVVNIGSTGVLLNNTGTALGILNLNGGTLLAPKIYKNVSGGTAIVNFNGGLWQATANGTIMGTGAGGAGAVTAAYVYDGGAFLDSSNFTVTVAQNLLAPSGNGVINLNWSGSLTGYVGAPYVAISGDGSNATAIALFDYTTGTVTGLVVTSPGEGYTTAPTVRLVGGNGNAANSTNLGVIADIGANTSGGLTKLGSGTLVLTGTNTYTGPTTITGGTLTLGASAIMTNTVRFELYSNTFLNVTAAGLPLLGQELKGSGTVLGNVIMNGGTLNPGNSVGTLTVGNLTLTNGVQLAFELGAPGASDLVIVTNALAFTGMETNWFILSAVSGFGVGTYTLFDALSYGSSTLGGGTNFTNIGNSGLDGYLWLDPDNQDVKLTVVPEPSAGALVGIGLLALLALRRWRCQT